MPFAVCLSLAVKQLARVVGMKSPTLTSTSYFVASRCRPDYSSAIEPHAISVVEEATTVGGQEFAYCQPAGQNAA